MYLALSAICGPPTCCYSLTLPRSQVNKILISAFLGCSNKAARAFDIPLGSSRARRAATMAATAKGDNKDTTVRLLFNGGDNMLGRAVQLSFPVQAEGEEYIKDSCPAYHYLDMCLHPSGHEKDLTIDEIRELNREGKYLWGDYLNLPISPPPDVRILNLETAVTKSIHNRDVPVWKGIRYHFHVDNLEPAVRAFAQAAHAQDSTTTAKADESPVIVSFANNHCMDYGRRAFEEETLPALVANPLFQTVGCGRDLSSAAKPAVVHCAEKKAVVEVFALSSGCSGTPEDWHATKTRSGLVGIPGLYSAQAVKQAMDIAKNALGMASCDAKATASSSGEEGKKRIRVVSIHWGPNWAMRGEGKNELAARREFAHRLIDECDVDLIYGHSSHHVRGMELYKNKLILYGTGDMINDYEGFENPGEEIYNRLGGLYIVDVNARTGYLHQLRIVPMYMNRLRLERYRRDSAIWRPNQRRLEVDASKSEDFCRFINKLSRYDAGADLHRFGGDESFPVLGHFDSDPDIPGGPVLKTKTYGA